MKRILLLLGLILAVEIVIGGVGTGVLNAQQEGVRRTELLKADLAIMGGKEANLVLVEFEPGATIAKHFHPGDELVYILEGSVIVEVEGEAAIALKAGDTFHQPPKQVHSGQNASTTDPVKLLVIWIVEKGQPLTVPVK